MLFQKGHKINVGRKLSEEAKVKIGLFQKTRIHSKEQNKKHSDRIRGTHHSEETKRKMSESAKRVGTGLWMIGKKHTEETRKKISLYQRSKVVSEETKRKMSECRLGTHPSEETKKKMSIIAKEKNYQPPRKSGENNHFWKGGITNNPYSVDWTKTLKRSIRERDKYICKICEKNQEDKAFPVHHIDYNKLNCDPTNLITLCPNCHTKTNFDRDYWIEYFNNK
jgi:hypothetical protein